jgi:hypothetical protein
MAFITAGSGAPNRSPIERGAKGETVFHVR